MASVHFGERFRDERTAAMGCWLDRRVKERGQSDMQEFERVRRCAAFDPTARFRLAILGKMEEAPLARWQATIEESSDRHTRDPLFWLGASVVRPAPRGV